MRFDPKDYDPIPPRIRAAWAHFVSEVAAAGWDGDGIYAPMLAAPGPLAADFCDRRPARPGYGASDDWNQTVWRTTDPHGLSVSRVWRGVSDDAAPIEDGGVR